jgi:hypothetical protein
LRRNDLEACSSRESARAILARYRGIALLSADNIQEVGAIHKGYTFRRSTRRRAPDRARHQIRARSTLLRTHGNGCGALTRVRSVADPLLPPRRPQRTCWFYGSSRTSCLRGPYTTRVLYSSLSNPLRHFRQHAPERLRRRLFTNVPRRRAGVIAADRERFPHERCDSHHD